MVANSKSSEAESEEEPVPPQPHSVAADLEETEDGYDLFIDTPGIQKSDAKASFSESDTISCLTKIGHTPAPIKQEDIDVDLHLLLCDSSLTKMLCSPGVFSFCWTVSQGS